MTRKGYRKNNFANLTYHQQDMMTTLVETGSVLEVAKKFDIEPETASQTFSLIKKQMKEPNLIRCVVRFVEWNKDHPKPVEPSKSVPLLRLPWHLYDNYS